MFPFPCETGCWRHSLDFVDASRHKSPVPMPIYLYEIVTDDPQVYETFEVLQDLDEPALERHPDTGLPVRRIITAPAVVGSTSSQRERNVLSASNIAAKGFSRYERVGDGTYARTAGNQGPKTFRKP